MRKESRKPQDDVAVINFVPIRFCSSSNMKSESIFIIIMICYYCFNYINTIDNNNYYYLIVFVPSYQVYVTNKILLLLLLLIIITTE